MRDNWLSNRIFKSFDDIVDHCCEAWNKLENQTFGKSCPSVRAIGLPVMIDESSYYIVAGADRAATCMLVPLIVQLASPLKPT